MKDLIVAVYTSVESNQNPIFMIYNRDDVTKI